MDKILQSYRNIPLVTQEASVRMLTVEDYPKWYDLFIVDPDAVHRLDSREYPVPQEVKNILYNNWFDHCITPCGFVDVAISLDCKFDEATWKAVNEMFIENQDVEEIPSIYIPSDELLNKVLIKCPL